MEAIKDTVTNLMFGLKARRKRLPQDDPGAWLKKLLTKKELAHIKVSSLRRGTLYINVDSSSWLYHLNLQKESLSAKISKNYPLIKDIRFGIGEIR